MNLLFPELSMEAFLKTTSNNPETPTVLSKRRGAREWVQAANEEAMKFGILKNQTIATARALHTPVCVHPHDPKMDEQCLKDLADELFRFTPDVSIDHPDGILLEIGSTTHLFPNETLLIVEAVELCKSHGLSMSVGVAPTPMSARVLARCTPPAVRRSDEKHFIKRISALPWSLLRPNKKTMTSCRMLGLKTIGDLLDLPPIGLATRLGEAIVQTLQLLFNEEENSPPIYRPDERFDKTIEWWPATTDLERLCSAAKKFETAINQFLEQRDMAATEASFFLTSGSEALTQIVALRPSRATLQGATFLMLLRMRLERDGVSQPVNRMRVTINETKPIDRVQGSLFEEMQNSIETPRSDLMDRLRNRLGENNVGRAGLVAEHRPEIAYQHLAVNDERDEWMATPPMGRRPLHMDAPPLPLEVEINSHHEPVRILRGHHRGTLTVISGPERLECGWWDGNDVRRLYFEVATSTGIRLWIFQDKNDGAWRRHGVFA